jgi:hypothetical protein
MAAATCPWCSAPRVAGAACPRCGANYAKAEQIKAHGRVAVIEEDVLPEPLPAVIVGAEDTAVDDPELEWKVTAAALPAMLALGVLFHMIMPGLQRILFGMPVHELGHAAAAWFCGFFAIPTLWKTIVFEGRGVVTPLLLAGGLGYLLFLAWRAEKMAYVAIVAGLLVLQAIGTFVIKEGTAEMLFVFGGDGIGMVLAACLMATFFFGKRTQLYKGWLRWGFLAIGAAAFADMFSTWFVAQWDFAGIPFGEIEGVGESDPVRLTTEFGWTTDQMVRRYVLVGSGSLAALAAVYAWGVMRARRKALEAARSRS